MTTQEVEPEAGAPDTGSRALVAGGSLLAIAMFGANAGNYALNVVLGRWLTPAEFADANLMVTLMLLVTAAAISLQLIGARFTGKAVALGEQSTIRELASGLERWALGAGSVFAAILIFGASVWANLFNSASAAPFVILGAGMPAYLLQAVGRGVLQGRLEFATLASTFIVEMLVRLVLGVVLVWLGFGVVGATIALSLSFFATWISVYNRLGWSLVIGWSRHRLSPEVFAYAGPVGLLLLGQIIINNGDVLVSKEGLEPTTAGIYAAVALVGRAVFFLSWSVATTIFPAAAQRSEAGENTNGLLHGGIVAVAAFGAAAVAGAGLLGGPILGRVFGPEYADVSGQLARYAFATAVFAMANLIVSHYLALGRVREAFIMLGGAIVQTTLLLMADRTIDDLITAQITAMVILFVAVAGSHIARLITGTSTVGSTP